MTSAFLKLFGYDEKVSELPQVKKWIADSIEEVVEYDSFLGKEEIKDKVARRELCNPDEKEHIHEVAKSVAIAFPNKTFGSDEEAILFAYNKINPIKDILAAGSTTEPAPEVDEAPDIVQKTEPVVEPIGRAEEKVPDSVNNSTIQNNGGKNIMAKIDDTIKELDALAENQGAATPAGTDAKTSKTYFGEASSTQADAMKADLAKQKAQRVAAAKAMNITKVIVAKPSVADRVIGSSGALGKVNSNGEHNIAQLYAGFKSKLGISPTAGALANISADGAIPEISVLAARYTNVEALRHQNYLAVFRGRKADPNKDQAKELNQYVDEQLQLAFAIEKAIAQAEAQPATTFSCVKVSSSLSIKGLVVNGVAKATDEIIKDLVKDTMGMITVKDAMDDDGALVGDKPFYAAVKLAKKTTKDKKTGAVTTQVRENLTYGNRKDFLANSGNVLVALETSNQRKDYPIAVLVKDSWGNDKKATVHFWAEVTKKDKTVEHKVGTFTLRTYDTQIQLASAPNGAAAAQIGDLKKYNITPESQKVARVKSPEEIAKKRKEDADKHAYELARIAATWRANDYNPDIVGEFGANAGPGENA